MKVGGGAAVSSHWPQFHTCEMGAVVLRLLGWLWGKPLVALGHPNPAGTDVWGEAGCIPALDSLLQSPKISVLLRTL